MKFNLCKSSTVSLLVGAVAFTSCVDNDKNRADDHHNVIIVAEQSRKQLAAGDKAACRIDCEENEDEGGGNA